MLQPNKIWGVVVLLLLCLNGLAQQNLFNAPSSEITLKNGVFFQQQFNITKSVVQSNTTLNYGIGKGFEVGMNILNLDYDFVSMPKQLIYKPLTKIKMKNSIIKVLTFLIFLGFTAQAQTVLKDGKLKLNEDGSHFVKFTMLNQIWLRNMNYNPGSTVFGYSKEKGTDIGIRRYRVQFFGQLTDRVFFYCQFGENNFNGISDRKLGFFVHDALGEYAVVKSKLSLGGGLSSWSGLARFASPSVGSILSVDAPLFQQTTNDVTDQFLRKLSVYAKGKLGKIDYRIAMVNPMAFQKSAAYSAAIKPISNFSSMPTKMQWDGYAHYEFFDQESNQTPFMAGTYLGKKKVFTIGAGFVYQPNAMWHIADNQKDTVQTAMVQYAVDAFYDVPVGKNGEAFSAYLNATHLNYGSNYTRNLGAMNPTNGTTNTTLLNGSGNGFPAYGTGNVLYAQAGYKLKDNLIGTATLMPYASIQSAKYERLNNQMNFVDVGVNVLLNGHTSKLTAAYQNRPLFSTSGDLAGHRGGGILQYQVYFNKRKYKNNVLCRSKDFWDDTLYHFLFFI